MPAPASLAFAKLAACPMQLQCTIQGQLWFSDVGETVQLELVKLK
jgi:uncharacterized protein YaeQ